jgi:hypothetical protein
VQITDPTITFQYYSFSVDGDQVLVTGLYADSPNAMVREAAYRIYLHPDKHQEYLLNEMLTSRHELAQLCGFSTFSHRQVYLGIRRRKRLEARKNCIIRSVRVCTLHRILLGELKRGGVMDGVCNMHEKNEKLIHFGHETEGKGPCGTSEHDSETSG